SALCVSRDDCVRRASSSRRSRDAERISSVEPYCGIRSLVRSAAGGAHRRSVARQWRKRRGPRGAEKGGSGVRSKSPPDSIRLVEVGLRDGLQAVSSRIPTADKVATIEKLIRAGFREIEAVSFAHPGALPQLADAEDVMDAVPRV